MLLVAAAFLGAVGSHALQYWLVPAPAQAADGWMAGPFGNAVQQDDGSLVVTAQNTMLTLAPDGTVRVTSPERLIIGTADDVKIEGYRVEIEASSSVEIETSTLTADVSNYKVEASRIELGQSNTDIKLADGDDPICINDDGDITRSDRVKAR